MENSFTQLLEDHIRRSEERDEHLRGKLEEICQRQEAVEDEVLGKMGDPGRPSLRGAIQHLQNNLGKLKEAEKERAGESGRLDELAAQVAELRRAEAARVETRKMVLAAAVTALLSSGASVWALVRSFVRAVS